MSTCRWAPFPPSLLENTAWHLQPQSLRSCSNLQHPYVCAVVSTLLPQYLPYYCSVRCITAVSALLPLCPPCYSSTGFSAASVIIFYCRQHPYYLSIIRVNAVWALLLHLKPYCCTASLLTVTAYRYSASGGTEHPVTSIPHWVADASSSLEGLTIKACSCRPPSHDVQHILISRPSKNAHEDMCKRWFCCSANSA